MYNTIIIMVKFPHYKILVKCDADMSQLCQRYMLLQTLWYYGQTIVKVYVTGIGAFRALTLYLHALENLTSTDWP